MVDRPNKPSAIAPSPISAHPQPIVDIDSGAGKVIARLPTGESVEVLLYGATVVSWKSQGRENLWLSDKAVLDGSKPVRGGIPIVFPVFGPPPKDHATAALPQHGFARNSRWEFLGKTSSESVPAFRGRGDDRVQLDFGLFSSKLSPDARKAWPYDFGLTYRVTLGPDTLQTALNVSNEGSQPFEFQTLLHSYFRVKDISKAKVTGLLGVEYVDKVQNASTQTEKNDAIPIQGEVDRVYSNIPQDTTSIVQDSKSLFDIQRDNLSDTVIWNPWTQKAAAMSDFEPKDGFKKMLCVEVGSVSGWQKLEAGETFEGGQIIRAHQD